MTWLRAERVVTGSGTLSPGWLLVDAGRIAAVLPEPPAAMVTDLGDVVVMPGFVDVHCHGGGGASFGERPEAIARAAAFHLGHGTTTVIGSLVTESPDVLRQQVRSLAAATRGGTVAGAAPGGAVAGSRPRRCARAVAAAPSRSGRGAVAARRGGRDVAHGDARAGAAGCPRPDRHAARRRGPGGGRPHRRRSRHRRAGAARGSERRDAPVQRDARDPPPPPRTGPGAARRPGDDRRAGLRRRPRPPGRRVDGGPGRRAGAGRAGHRRRRGGRDRRRRDRCSDRAGSWCATGPPGSPTAGRWPAAR